MGTGSIDERICDQLHQQLHERPDQQCIRHGCFPHGPFPRSRNCFTLRRERKSSYELQHERLLQRPIHRSNGLELYRQCHSRPGYSTDAGGRPVCHQRLVAETVQVTTSSRHLSTCHELPQNLIVKGIHGQVRFRYCGSERPTRTWSRSAKLQQLPRLLQFYHSDLVQPADSFGQTEHHVTNFRECGNVPLIKTLICLVDKPNVELNLQTASKVSSVYATVDDIDLFLGGVAEIPLSSGGLLGPTFACLVGETFQKIKYGDRFFYEIGSQPHSFSSS